MNDQLLMIFRGITIADVVIVLMAIAFLWEKGKAFVLWLTKRHDKEQEEEYQLSQIEELRKQTMALATGLLSLLRYRLYRECEKHIAKGSLNIKQLGEIEDLYTAYHTLGGNGTGDKLYKDVKKLPIRR